MHSEVFLLLAFGLGLLGYLMLRITNVNAQELGRMEDLQLLATLRSSTLRVLGNTRWRLVLIVLLFASNRTVLVVN